MGKSSVFSDSVGATGACWHDREDRLLCIESPRLRHTKEITMPQRIQSERIQPFVPLVAAPTPPAPKRWNGYQVDSWAIEDLRPPSRQVRRHEERQVAKLAAIIDRFGFLVPLLVTPDGELITGTARVEAARKLGWKSVPAICVEGKSPAEIRMLRLADNRASEL